MRPVPYERGRVQVTHFAACGESGVGGDLQLNSVGGGTHFIQILLSRESCCDSKVGILQTVSFRQCPAHFWGIRSLQGLSVVLNRDG